MYLSCGKFGHYKEGCLCMRMANGEMHNGGQQRIGKWRVKDHETWCVNKGREERWWLAKNFKL